MKIAIDLDGTAWKYQDYFRDLIRNLRNLGHEVGILTAHSKDIEGADKRLLKARGFPEVDFFINKTNKEKKLSSKEWKIKKCEEYDIDILFDDFDTNLPQVYIKDIV